MMNEELQNAITSLISGVLSSADKAGDFLAGELPVYLAQLITWYGVYNFILFITGLVLFIVPAIVDYKIGKRMLGLWSDDDFWSCYVIAGSIVRLFVYSFPFVFMNLTWLKIWIAPKVWLLEYMATLGGVK
jgi:hypothetical protein